MNDTRVLATIQQWDAKKSIWKQKRNYDRTTPVLPQARYSSRQKLDPVQIPLTFGGSLTVYPNAVQDITLIRDEILGSKLFRQYCIQANPEPRTHFLLHSAAEHNFDDFPQPGYRYASISMKARPLSLLPNLDAVSKDLAKMSGVRDWNIGVNPVLYRADRDHMGNHADDDQGERIILCLIVVSPQRVRRVHIRPLKFLKGRDGDEKIDLFLEPGDAYEMNGLMQFFYSHSVPQPPVCLYDTINNDDESRRLSVVFRTGDQVIIDKDSGRERLDLSPRPIQTYTFGSAIRGLEEGGVYERMHLYHLGAHIAQQRGVSGNKDMGCASIIVAGKREDGLGTDEFHTLMYAASTTNGALAMAKSCKEKRLIRVFRSSAYASRFRARKETKNKKNMYRYDGLYFISRYEEGRVYKFFMTRLGINVNALSNEEFLRLHNIIKT
jgi:alkylated DNA repair dioxygenase AlkB